MSSNGCGMWGALSKAWRKLSGNLPPFEGCCDEHDLAYEQIETEEERAWADKQFLRCVQARGYPVTGFAMTSVIRAFGWFTWIKRKF